ncbi:hypothetical protein F5X96DRAFT_590409 [Biscogniauxia mediterranea]|nr:hypothetical protein F5X96DRAFT_590409 [Biscogniauxia mediterranea]
MTTSGATTNARGEVAYPAPGAFPTDPLTPKETLHDAPILDGVNPDSTYRGSNKLRKRDDPRGQDGRDAQQFTQASSRGHKHVDSGVHVPDMDTQPGYTGNSSKPGVMTGAYSRLPNHEHGRGHGSTTIATDGVPIYANSPVSPVSPTTSSATGTNTRDYGHTGPQHPHTTSGYNHNHGTAAGLAGATTLAGGASAASSHAATSRDHHPTSTSSAQGAGAALAPHREDKFLEQQKEAEAVAERERNLVRNGRDPSSVARKDPYWGDVPFGTGVYNGVSGHGSAETPHTGTVGSAAPAQHYPHEGQVPREGLQQHQQQKHAGGDGVAHQATSKPGHVHIAGQQQQQRAFPLTDPQGISAGGADQTGTEKLVPGQAHQNRDSRFSEGRLAGAGVGAGVAAGAGYVASGLGDKRQQTRRTDEHDGLGRKNDAEDYSSQGPVGGGLRYRDDHNNKEVRQHKEKDAKDASPYHGSKAQDVDSKGDKHHSKETAAAAAAAAAGTGAAASYATRDKKSREPDYDEGSEKKESKLHALFHRKDKDEKAAKEAGSASSRYPSTTTTTQPQHHHAYDDKNAVTGSRQTQAAKRDPFIASGYPEHTHHQHTSTSPTSIYPTSDKLSKQAIGGDHVRGPEHDVKHGDHSKLGLGAAGVAAGAGAGAGYLAHRQHEQPSSSMASSSSPSTHHTTNVDNVAASPKTTTAGTTLPPTAAVNTTTPHGAKATTHTAQPQPQPQPHYKTLASGTPSGIAVDASQNHHHHHHQDHASSAALPTTNRSSTGSSTTDSSGNSKGYRYAGAAGAGAGALGAGGAALLGKEEDKEQKVALTHRCRRCGEENDISGYFRGE